MNKKFFHIFLIFLCLLISVDMVSAENLNDISLNENNEII